MASDIKINAIAPWFGSGRIGAKLVGHELRGCSFVGIPFGGGMCELQHVRDARTVLVNDLHSHVINLASVIADDELRPELIKTLEGLPFHPSTLSNAQESCRTVWGSPTARENRTQWAADYFVAAWMARNGTAGTEREFEAGISLRWNANGGDSAKRFRNATQSLDAWSCVMRRCTFTCADGIEMVERFEDSDGHAIYIDVPFPGPGAGYRHKFNDAMQRRLACALRRFTRTRVVCRFYDHPLVRELYGDDGWEWKPRSGRKQTNEKALEFLIVRNGSTS